MGTNVHNYNRHQNQQVEAAAGAESNNGGRRWEDRRSRSALPMLCSRNSIKDVAVPTPGGGGGGSRTPFSGGENENDDPLSPKIGCMGQVKRNNRIGGIPASSSNSSASSSYSSVAAKFITSHPPPLPAVKYLKLKRVFSARNLTTGTSSSERPNRSNKNNNVDADRRHKPSSSSSSSGTAAVNVEEIDPPLPVRSKRFETAAAATQSEKSSLWERRRTGRMGLKNLELQGITVHQQQQLSAKPTFQFQPTTV